MNKKFKVKAAKRLVYMLAAAAMVLVLLPAAALAAPEQQEDQAQSVGIRVTAKKVELMQPDGTKTELPAAKNVTLRQSGKGDLRGLLGNAGIRSLNSEDSQAWNASVWRQIYDDAVAAGLATENKELEAYMENPGSDAGQFICMVLETLGIDGLPTTELTAPAGGKLQNADGSEAGEIPVNAKVSALNFCVDGRVAVLADGVLRFLPVESLRTADGVAAGEELQWVATKPCGYYDEKTDTTVVVLPNGQNCELAGNLDSLTVENSVQGDVTLGNANIDKAYYFGEGNLIVGSGAKVNSVETTDKGKVKADGGSMGSIKQVEKLNVTLLSGTDTLPIDENVSLKVAANARGVRWSVSNPSVVRVETRAESDTEAWSDARVYGIGTGGSLVTAWANGQRASVWIGALPHAQKMDFMRVPGAQIKVGETFPLIYGFWPSGAYKGYNVIWETSDPSVVMVAGVGFNGLTGEQEIIYREKLAYRPATTVLGVGPGTATITVRTADGRLSANYVVTVEKPSTFPYLMNSNGEEIKNITLLKGETYTLTGTDPILHTSTGDIINNKEPAAFFDIKYDWGNTYTVYAKEAGVGILTCKFDYQEEQSVLIGVADPLPEKLTLREGQSYLLGTGESMGLGLFQITDDGVAEIREENEGLSEIAYYLEAKKPGDTIISLWGTEGYNSRKLSECHVTVQPAAQSVTLSQTSLLLQTGELVRLAATVLPEEAYSKKVTWQSDNPAVATVDGDGNVMALSPGKTKVTATAEAGGKSAECEVTVTPSVNGVTLNKSAASLVVGEYVKLTATLLPEGAASEITWTTSDPAVVTVDENGGITAIAPGRAKITATVDGRFTATCEVTVIIPVTGVELDKNEATLDVGGYMKLTATPLPEGAASEIIWTTSDPAVATVDENGGITAVTPGSAKITATADGRFTAVCEVTVIIPVTGVELDKTEATLVAGGYIKLTATPLPEGAASEIIWTTSDPTVAAVDENGGITAAAPGRAKITATADGKFTATCDISACPAVSSITLNEMNLKMYTGDTFKLQPVVLPAEANQEVTYSGNDESVATVAADGTVTAKGPGRMTITVRTEDIQGKDGVIQGKFVQCFVQVTDYVAVTNINMKETASVEAKKTIMLEAEVMPMSASVKDVTWSSSDPSVATISDGVVTGASEGTAVITAASVDNSGITASCTVTVIPEGGIRVQKVVVTSSGWPGGFGQTNPYPGDTTTVTATVTPSDATYDNITWMVEGGLPVEGEVIRITPIGNGSTATLEVLREGSGSYHIRAMAGGVASSYEESFVISTIEVPPIPLPDNEPETMQATEEQEDYGR